MPAQAVGRGSGTRLVVRCCRVTGAGDDLAVVLNDRVTRWLEAMGPAADQPALVAGLVPAARSVTDPELARTLGDIEQLISARTHALVTGLLHRPPAWAVPLGPPPRDNAARRAWLDAMAVVAGYRDLHQIHHDQRPSATPTTGTPTAATTGGAPPPPSPPRPASPAAIRPRHPQPPNRPP